MIVKILGREEKFHVSVRRGANILRRARDSTLLLLPPLEVIISSLLDSTGGIAMNAIFYRCA
jgi:hypothetical protein